MVSSSLATSLSSAHVDCPRTDCDALLGATSKAIVCDGGTFRRPRARTASTKSDASRAAVRRSRTEASRENHWHGTVVGCEDVIGVGSVRGVRQCGSRHRPGRVGRCPLNCGTYRIMPTRKYVVGAHMARLLSVNVGLPRDINWRGKTVYMERATAWIIHLPEKHAICWPSCPIPGATSSTAGPTPGGC
jgi:hypothetical protein